MQYKKNGILIYCLLGLLLLFIICWFLVNYLNIEMQFGPDKKKSSIAYISEIKSMNNGTKWTRCFRTSDGAIYFKNHLKSKDGGKTLVSQTDVNVEDINGAPERAVYTIPGLFYALDGPTEYMKPGVYKGKSWRSVDNLKTLQQEDVTFNIPGGAKPQKKPSEWFGLFVYRTILKMPDGSWLLTMEGQFGEDTIVPADKDAAKETEFMARSIIVKSTDEGKTWNYLSTIAIPKPGDAIGEGFVEPAIALLDDDRIICILRSGHHFPLYSSWSSDSGKTWTPPVYTGLDRGCDPCLIKLHDGRLALSWGRRFPEGWSKVTPEGDKGLFVYPGEGYTNLSISNDGGVTWTNHKIAQKTGSCYSTIFEVEPNILFMQVDQWYCRITLSTHGQLKKWRHV